MNNFLIFICLFSGIQIAYSSRKVVGCYWSSWSYERNASGQSTTNDIDGNLCTHVYYSFIGLNNATQDLAILDSDIAIDANGYRNFTNLKTQYPQTKFLVAIGGWGEGSFAYSVLAGNATKRARFINQILSFICQYGFDGLDFDWEYPTERDTYHGSADRDNFVTLLRETKAAFAPLGLVLTIAIGASPRFIDVAYDVRAISEIVDLINFMSYDFHGSWDTVTGINAPLFDPTSNISVSAFVPPWLEAGLDPSKFILGIPFYGKAFTLTNATNNGIGAPVSGAGLPGPYISDAGNLAYSEILKNIEEGWTVVYDEDFQSPYAYSGNQWVGYDNERSIQEKVNFACSNSLGGVMTWAIDLDDFRGLYGLRRPLLNALNQIHSCN